MKGGSMIRLKYEIREYDLSKTDFDWVTGEFNNLSTYNKRVVSTSIRPGAGEDDSDVFVAVIEESIRED